MNLFCFIISYAVVSVSTDDEADCKKQFLITNLAIARAFNINDFTVENNFGLNGLEYVMEAMEAENRVRLESFGKLNSMIAVPEKTEYVLQIPEIDWLNGMKKCELLQFWFRQELAVALDLPLPDDINQRIDDPEFDNDQNFGDLDLTELADQRRSHVVSALINMIRRGPLRNVDDDVYLLWMSRMVGLYMSARVPTSYIKQVWTNTHKRTFTLWDGITHKRYKRILGVWNQINLNNSGSVQLLENQLRRLDEELILL